MCHPCITCLKWSVPKTPASSQPIKRSHFELKVFDAIILPTIQRQLGKSESKLYNLERKFLAQDSGEAGWRVERRRMDWRGGAWWLQTQKSFEQRKQWPLRRAKFPIWENIFDSLWSNVPTCSRCYHLQCVSPFSHQTKRRHSEME